MFNLKINEKTGCVFSLLLLYYVCNLDAVRASVFRAFAQVFHKAMKL